MTVRDLFTTFDALAGQDAASVSPATRIGLLDVAKTEFWRILVGRNPQENWFVAESQSGSSGQPDYLPPLTTSAREYALPSDFKKARSIEVVGSLAVEHWLEKSSIDDESFRIERQAGRPWPARVLYDFVGTSSRQITFASYPPAALTLRMLYVKRPLQWSAQDTNIDEFPADSHDLIVEYAVTRHVLGKPDKENRLRWREFDAQWRRRVERWIDTDHNDNTAPDVVRGFYV